MLDLTVRVIPLVALVAGHPEATINVLILRIAEVDLVAVVTLIVLLEALIAVAAKIDRFVSPVRQLNCRKLGFFLRY